MRVGVFDRHSDAGECTVDTCPSGRSTVPFWCRNPILRGYLQAAPTVGGFLHENMGSGKKFTKQPMRSCKKGLISGLPCDIIGMDCR